MKSIASLCALALLSLLAFILAPAALACPPSYSGYSSAGYYGASAPRFRLRAVTTYVLEQDDGPSTYASDTYAAPPTYSGYSGGGYASGYGYDGGGYYSGFPGFSSYSSGYYSYPGYYFRPRFYGGGFRGGFYGGGFRGGFFGGGFRGGFRGSITVRGRFLR